MFACAALAKLIKFINILIFTRFQHEKESLREICKHWKKSRICEATKKFSLSRCTISSSLVALSVRALDIFANIYGVHSIITFHNLAIAFIEIVNCTKKSLEVEGGGGAYFIRYIGGWVSWDILLEEHILKWDIILK